MSRPRAALLGAGAAVLLLVLAGCGQDGVDPGKAAATGPVETGADDDCRAIAMARALPAATMIAGRPLAWTQCSVQEVVASYGKEDADGNGDDSCRIEISDSRYPIPESARALGMQETLENTRELIREMARANVEMLVESRKALEAEPVMLRVRGGPSTLPVVGSTATGDAYVISVPASADVEVGNEPLLSLVNDRYVLTIECDAPVRDHDQALALYAPYVRALNLGVLP
ncbi:hypothetical protein [Marilutibacter aestuarii]|uniref:DUF3558 domain-containing protein n=1 Tax=Marilutibacter aestuarii TaxID=1706195 RepID=A0A507ZZW0_9GAMM|nr:hypothetical protein [Lysobacter aestuarii]TQD43280.1 hypothetical protein FKV25_10770 [Lysobacter aestuarii]